MKCITKNCVERAANHSNFCEACRRNIKLDAKARRRHQGMVRQLSSLDEETQMAFPVQDDKYIRVTLWMLALLHFSGITVGLLLGKLFL